jgi:hypothetical protein
MRDVIKCLEYVGKGKFNEVELLQKENDAVVLPILHELGIDVRKDIYITAVKHRDLQNNVGIGYRYYGTIRSDRQWVNSKGCDVIERVAITSFNDLSLTNELCKLLNKRIDITEADGAYALEDELNSVEYVVETYEADSATMRNLNQICRSIRGDE